MCSAGSPNENRRIVIPKIKLMLLIKVGVVYKEYGSKPMAAKIISLMISTIPLRRKYIKTYEVGVGASRRSGMAAAWKLAG